VETDLYAFPNLFQGDMNPDAENFVSLYKDIYDTIGQPDVSPDTFVFTTYQYETFVVLDLMGLTSVLEERWDYVSMFDEYLDVFAISTFPVAIPTYVTPESVPDDYFGMIEERIDIPVVIAETGWPSSGEGFGSEFRSEEAQARFVFRLLDLTKNLNLAGLIWFFLSDPASITGLKEEFYSSGLLKENGTSKLVFTDWQDLFNVPYEKPPEVLRMTSP